MRQETFHQVDYRVKYVLEQMASPHFRVVNEDAVAKSYWLAFVRQMNAQQEFPNYSEPMSLAASAVADAYIARVVKLSPINSPHLYSVGES